MGQDDKKTIAEINAGVHIGRSVVAAVEPLQSEESAAPTEKKVDVVTSATLKNNMYRLPMPVMMPLPQPTKDKKSE